MITIESPVIPFRHNVAEWVRRVWHEGTPHVKRKEMEGQSGGISR